MGWTSFHRTASVKDTMADVFASPNYKIIDAAIVNRSEYYAAVEYTADTSYAKKGDVVALVCMLKYAPRSEYNFSYKSMDETMGPNIDHCPARILDLLTETTNEYANKWRERCRTRISRPRPKAGQIVKFARPIEFTNGYTFDTFRYESGSRFTSVPHPALHAMTDYKAERLFGGLYRITNWKDSEYTIVGG